MDQILDKDYDTKPEISVVIPIYNVASYLSRCLDSCRAQTMKNLQFVLVDDGSTDGGGEIADRYAREDCRFQVYHTENHGLSAALNYGLDRTEADWIMTIDSDDWVHPQFCELPYSAAKEFDAELVIFNYSYAMGGKIRKGNFISTRGVVDVVKAVETGSIPNWNKLYHRRLFEDFRFPVGKNHADQLATAQMVYKAKRIAAIPDHLYYYQYRENSLSKSKNKETFQTLFITQLERNEYLLSCGFPKERTEKFLFYDAMLYLKYTQPDRNDKLYQKAVSILDEIKTAPAEYGWKGKVKLTVWKISPALFHLMYYFVRKVKK